MDDLNTKYEDPQAGDNSSQSTDSQEGGEIDYAKELERLIKENEEIKSKYERNKERLEGEKLTSHFASGSISKVHKHIEKNPIDIVELHMKDPEKADRVAKMFDGFNSYEDFINDPEYVPFFKKLYPELYKTKELSEEEVEARVMERFEKKQIEEKVAGLDENVRDKFDYITEGKKLTLENIDTHIQNAEKLAGVTSSKASSIIASGFSGAKNSKPSTGGIRQVKQADGKWKVIVS